MAKASKVSNEGLSLKSENMEEGGSGRRDLVFAAAAAAVCSIAKVAAAGEPKRGTAEAKKEYAPVCVTMPTARICHK
ncbi:photosystem II 5 kD protein [Actinidia rufa]|nr:photosystem II 5 kD protein [Actinidia rufa]